MFKQFMNRVFMVYMLVGQFLIKQVLIFRLLHLMFVLVINGARQILLKMLMFLNAAHVRLQVRKSLMELTHEHRVICLAEISMIIASELIVAIDHMANGLHHPLNSVHGADAISIAIENCDRCVADVLDGDVCSDSVLLTLNVGVSILLESALNTHLEEM